MSAQHEKVSREKLFGFKFYNLLNNTNWATKLLFRNFYQKKTTIKCTIYFSILLIFFLEYIGINLLPKQQSEKLCASTNAHQAVLPPQLVLMQKWNHGTTLGRLRKDCGLWRSAPTLCGWEHTPVSSAAPKHHCSPGISRLEPMACDSAGQRRLSAEPRMPFLHQMYL